jgi:mRNA-degrading endonuclease RelE of RelBE toxin-antitoxin system
MPYDVFLPEFFKRIVKDLKKKYPSVTEDLKPALRLVASNPNIGKGLQGFGDIMKLRVKNSDIGKGKSGGYRLIYLVDQDGQKVIPLLIYSKSQKQDVTSKELKALLAKLDQELSE